jgi:anhydro-N-acetylmuramic acid kinase
MGSVLTAIGLMSGTSLDGVDAALLRTDGLDFVEAGPARFLPYGREMKVWLRRAVKAALEGRDAAEDIAKADAETTAVHAQAVEALLAASGVRRQDVDVVGFPGQTILHRPAHSPESVGRTWQIGNGALLAEELRIDVVDDFRSADVAAGGEGAPFAPLYHRVLVNALEPSGAVGVLNIGGVANVTFVPEGSEERDLLAFDCGPGNGLIDEWLELKTGRPMDEQGGLAATGAVHEEALRMMLLHPYLRRTPPKSLDRYDFKLDPVRALSAADGAATLTAFTAACVASSLALLPTAPEDWIVCGGGRRNPVLMSQLKGRIEASVVAAEEVGWRGDDLEAQTFAYLAVRSLMNLPLSYPDTTRAPRPMPGGKHHRGSGRL